MTEAGLSYQNPSSNSHEAEPEDRDECHDDLKKKRRGMDATVVYVGQRKNSERVEPCSAWFPCGTRPSVELPGQRDWTCVLGAIAESSDRFCPRFDEYVTVTHATDFTLASCDGFQEDLIVDSVMNRTFGHWPSRAARSVTTSPS